MDLPAGLTERSKVKSLAEPIFLIPLLIKPNSRNHNIYSILEPKAYDKFYKNLKTLKQGMNRTKNQLNSCGT